ncbi:hypothetical protein ACFQHP_11745 [Halomicroarcula sp. GCM10025743]
MRRATDEVKIEYRCRGCDYAFSEALAGVVACPRWHAIDDHARHSRGPAGG